MSIYSGFATRNQEKYYDKVLYNVISTLMVRVLKFYKTEEIDEKAFRKIIKDQHKVISKLEKHKYVDPKYADLLEHFMKVLDKNQQEKSSKEDQHLQFELRRKSIEDPETLTRTFSVLGREINELQNYTEKIDTLEYIDDLSSDKGLELIPERKKKEHSKKKQKKIRSTSLKNNVDIWDVRKEKLPEIPVLNPISQHILSRTRFHNFSEKLTNKTIDVPVLEREPSTQIILERAPKFRAKVFFK